MAENTVDSTINSLIADDDIPLGNHSPLLVPPALGQSFLQLKFLYPLGAVSLLNPDNFDFERGGDLLNESFNGSPFFDNPIQPLDLRSTPQGISQAKLQAKLQAKSLIQKSSQLSTDKNISDASDQFEQLEPVGSLSQNSQFNDLPTLQKQHNTYPISNNLEDSNNQKILNTSEVSNSPIDNKSTIIKPQADLDSTDNYLQRNAMTTDVLVSSNTESSNVIGQTTSLNTNDRDITNNLSSILESNLDSNIFEDLQSSQNADVQNLPKCRRSKSTEEFKYR